MRFAPSGAATPRSRPSCSAGKLRRTRRAPAQAAPGCPLRSAEHSLSRLVRPAACYTSPPSAGDRTVFDAFATHTTGAHRFAEPVVSHKNEFCLLRPSRRAPRPLGATLNHPVGLRPLQGPSPLVRPRPAAAVHVLARSRPSVDHAKRVDKFTTQELRGGLLLRSRQPP